jgi:flagellar protein FliT
MPEMRDLLDLLEMQPQDRILLQYEALAGVTSTMLAAARIEDWDALVTLEAESAALVTTLQRDEALLALQQGEALATLSESQRQQKAALIVQMLADDGELRQLVAARMAQLSNQMHSASTVRKLTRAYGA